MLNTEVNGLIIQAREKNSNTVYGYFVFTSDPGLRPAECVNDEVSVCVCVRACICGRARMCIQKSKGTLVLQYLFSVFL